MPLFLCSLIGEKGDVPIHHSGHPAQGFLRSVRMRLSRLHHQAPFERYGGHSGGVPLGRGAAPQVRRVLLNALSYADGAARWELLMTLDECFCRVRRIRTEDATHVRNGRPLCSQSCTAAYDEIVAANGSFKGGGDEEGANNVR